MSPYIGGKSPSLPHIHVDGAIVCEEKDLECDAAAMDRPMLGACGRVALLSLKSLSVCVTHIPRI
jgi:hypothetical protein